MVDGHFPDCSAASYKELRKNWLLGRWRSVLGAACCGCSVPLGASLHGTWRCGAVVLYPQGMPVSDNLLPALPCSTGEVLHCSQWQIWDITF